MFDLRSIYGAICWRFEPLLRTLRLRTEVDSREQRTTGSAAKQWWDPVFFGIGRAEFIPRNEVSWET